MVAFAPPPLWPRTSNVMMWLLSRVFSVSVALARSAAAPELEKTIVEPLTVVVAIVEPSSPFFDVVDATLLECPQAKSCRYPAGRRLPAFRARGTKNSNRFFCEISVHRVRFPVAVVDTCSLSAHRRDPY